MYILGISCYYHDSSATLLKDGKVIAAAEQERFSRKKHDKSFPIDAITFCLETAGITSEDISYVAFYEKPLLKFERILYQHLESFPKSLKTFLGSMPSCFNSKLRILKTLKKQLGYKGRVLFVPHHVAHAASSFYPSSFEKSAIITVDGVGEWTTTAYGVGEGHKVELHKEIRFPHSIGLLYSTITAYLGFSVNNSEYKVMGLAAYGDMNRETNPYYERLRSVIDLKEDGSYRLNMLYFVYHYKDRMPSKKLEQLLGGPTPKWGVEAKIDQRAKDIAAALQLVTEDVLIKIFNHVHKETGVDTVVYAGGVALNSAFNGKILKKTPFKSIWIQPNSSDGGTSMGAALFVHHHILGNERREDFRTSYLGPAFRDEEIKDFLDGNGIKYSHLGSDDVLTQHVAKLLAENNVIGWFQGGMEWGPRALGSRSILANPANPDAQALLNEKVKHREKFRPFAPVVTAEDAPKYFECDDPLPKPADYMLMVYPIKEEYRSKIPAVTHIDGSGRLQTIRKEQNPLYYDLLKEMEKLSGLPILINTSFNIRGEPIVCTPYDAYRCMMGTQIDCLVMGKYPIWRKDNPQDMWDSEALAHD